MLVFNLENPKAINPDQLAGELGYSDPLSGHGLSIVFNEEGMALVAYANLNYSIGGVDAPAEARSISLSREAFEAAVLAHVPA